MNINDLKETIKKLKSKKVWTMIVGLLGTTAIFTAGFFLKGIYPNLFVPLMLTGAGIPIFTVLDSEEAGHKALELEQRVDHIEENDRMGVARNDRIEKKKVAKANKLENEYEEVRKRMSKRNISFALTALVWIAGTVGSIVYPPAMWAAIAGLLSLSATSGCEIIDDSKIHELSAQIENIKTDLLMGPTHGYDPEYSVDGEIQIAKEEELTNGKAIANPEYEKEIDQYLSLENTSSNDKEKVFVK